MSALRFVLNERPTHYATVEALQELNARIEELTARIDQYLADVPVAEPEARPVRAPALRCPQCNKRAFRKSRRSTLGERLSALVLMRPFRCRYCAHFEFLSIFTSIASD